MKKINIDIVCCVLWALLGILNAFNLFKNFRWPMVVVVILDFVIAIMFGWKAHTKK